MKNRLVSFAFFLTIVLAAAVPASAQVVYGPYVPAYTTWQPQWDRYQFDRRHVVLGTVTHFAPYRLEIQRPDGVIQTIDLKDGTVILPTGATPAETQHVAIVGYYSRGTFIANRVILRN
jgi:hypothetical protein